MITFAALAALLSCAGCIVTTSTYDAKVREVEALRDAYASSNRETLRLAGEVESLAKRADACEAGRTREKRESADCDRELAEFRKKTGTKEEPAARSGAE